MRKRYVSDVIVDVLRKMGTEYIALNPGGSFSGLHESIVNYGGDKDPKIILCNHENIAVGIAHGYAKAAGKPMAVATHDVVGLLNCSLGIYLDWLDQAPVIIFGGAHPMAIEERETGVWQHVAQNQGDLARKESFVTLFAPVLSGTYQPSPAFKATLSYELDGMIYDNAITETNATHRGYFNLGGKSGNTAWEILNSAAVTNGSDEGLVFASGGDIPALGGIPIRDRRDAAVYRNSFKATHTMGRAFLRPSLSSYVHDFRTVQLSRTGAYAGYENYVDRYELSGGLDAGFEAVKRIWVVLGLRYGRQHQGELLGTKSPYSNNYQRFLAGLEGTVPDRAKFSFLVGPDIRDFDRGTPAGFERKKTLLYFEASASLTPTDRDTLVLTARQYEQPAFSSQSVYEDIQYQLSLRHKFCDRLTASAGFKIYGGVWQAPVFRKDWIFTPSAGVSSSITKDLAGELSYLYDTVSSRIADTGGREYIRHILSIGLKQSF